MAVKIWKSEMYGTICVETDDDADDPAMRVNAFKCVEEKCEAHFHSLDLYAKHMKKWHKKDLR